MSNSKLSDDGNEIQLASIANKEKLPKIVKPNQTGVITEPALDLLPIFD